MFDTHPGPVATPGGTTPSGTRTVPFDYVFSLEIKGKKGRTDHALINVSTVGTFVANAIGYGLELDAPFGPVDPIRPAPGGDLLVRPRGTVLVPGDTGVDPPIEVRGTPGDPVVVLRRGVPSAIGKLDEEGRLRAQASEITEGWTSGSPLTVVDPRTDARITVQTLEGDGRQYVTVQPQFAGEDPLPGEEELTIAATPGKTVRVRIYGGPVVGNEGSRLEGEVQAERDGLATVKLADLREGDAQAAQGGPGTPRCLCPGDIVVLADPGEQVFSTRTIRGGPARGPRTNLARLLDLRLRDLPIERLESGFRFNRTVFERIANGGPPTAAELEHPFDALGSDSCELQFLYGLFDNGSGRAFQNELVHNIAGLGTPSGQRPFRYLPTPIVIEPKTVLRFEIREISGGPGRLHVTLQGYKVIGARPRSTP